MLIDHSFLSVHPATIEWWDRREKCLRCKHLRLIHGPEGEAVMRCKLSKQKGKRGAGYCIDSRLPEAACGPQARLFEEKT